MSKSYNYPPPPGSIHQNANSQGPAGNQQPGNIASQSRIRNSSSPSRIRNSSSQSRLRRLSNRFQKRPKLLKSTCNISEGDGSDEDNWEKVIRAKSGVSNHMQYYHGQTPSPTSPSGRLRQLMQIKSNRQLLQANSQRQLIPTKSLRNLQIKSQRHLLSKSQRYLLSQSQRYLMSKSQSHNFQQKSHSRLNHSHLSRSNANQKSNTNHNNNSSSVKRRSSNSYRIGNNTVSIVTNHKHHGGLNDEDGPFWLLKLLFPCFFTDDD